MLGQPQANMYNNKHNGGQVHCCSSCFTKDHLDASLTTQLKICTNWPHSVLQWELNGNKTSKKLWIPSIHEACWHEIPQNPRNKVYWRAFDHLHQHCESYCKCFNDPLP